MPASDNKFDFGNQLDKFCLSLAVLAVFGFAAAIVLFNSWAGKVPPEDLASSAVSPDGQYKASEYFTDLGATGGNAFIRLKRAADTSS